MKCYTVSERKTDGIKIQRNEAGTPVFRVGSAATATEVQVSKDIVQMFEDRESAILEVQCLLEDQSEEGSAKLRKFLTALTGTDPVSWDEKQGKMVDSTAAVARAWASEDPAVMWLLKADISDNEPIRIIKERRSQRRSDFALVHVETASDGQFWYEGSGCTECVVEGHRPYVRKEQHTFPSPGVSTVATGYGANNEPQGLFLMIPKSSFRINRDVWPPVLVVAWPGSTLQCFAPAKYREEKKRKSRAG